MTEPVALAEVTRTVGDEQIVESVHHGHLVVVGPAGDEGALGDPSLVTFPRSTSKPFQAIACLELLAAHGREDVVAELCDEELAIAWASHRGERMHLDAVSRLLARSGTAPEALTCPTAIPEADTVWPPTTPNEPPSRLRFNCSGKHALFALTGQAMGLSGEALIDPDGPLQQAVLEAVADAIGPLHGWGVDGCGAPAVRSSLRGLASGYRQLAAGGRWARARDAGFAHPLLVGGTGRLESALLAHRVVAKVGAEGVYAAGWTDEHGEHHGIAVKGTDGAVRGAAVAMFAVLVARGAVPGDAWSPEPVTGGPATVGEVRAAPAVTRVAWAEAAGLG